MAEDTDQGSAQPRLDRLQAPPLNIKMDVQVVTHKDLADNEARGSPAHKEHRRNSHNGCARGSFTLISDRYEDVHQELTVNNELSNVWQRREGDTNPWSGQRVKWCFINRLFANDNFVTRLQETQDGHTIPQPPPEAPTLEEAHALTGRDWTVKSIDDFHVNDLLSGVSHTVRQITSFGAVDTEGPENGFLVCIMTPAQGTYRYGVCWMRNRQCALVQNALNALSAALGVSSNGSFTWCSWGGDESANYGTSDLQVQFMEARALAHEVKLCKALGLLRSNDELRVRKNADGIKVWEMMPKRATRMFDTNGTDWNDPEAAVAHVNDAFDPSVVNLCIADCRATLEIATAMNHT